MRGKLSGMKLPVIKSTLKLNIESYECYKPKVGSLQDIVLHLYYNIYLVLSYGIFAENGMIQLIANT